MGSRGPQPTPTKILESRGSWRAKTREGEPQPDVEAPSCPSWLGREARAEWKRIEKCLIQMQLLARMDRALLAAYCEAWGEFCELVKRIDRVVSEGGYEAAIGSRLLDAKNASVKRLVQLASQFGMSPAARTRIRQMSEPEETRSDGKGRFFKTVG